MPPTAPPKPPNPTTDATADRGNESDVVVYRFADQPWCAAAARLINPTVSHIFPPENITIDTGTTQTAHISMVVLRAAVTDQPRASNADDSQPPPIDPTSAAR